MNRTSGLSVPLLDCGASFCAVVAALALIAGLAPAVVAQNSPIDGGTRADWPHYGGTQSAWRYSALDQINTTNVKNLSPVWMFQTGEYADGLTSTPIVADGVMYVSTTPN